ncbi:MAG TPA: hypothetical protein VEC93_04950, partial [Anaerolineae bacterium]|nr:hypothetical protein [Anaerolineae bacterium]
AGHGVRGKRLKSWVSGRHRVLYLCHIHRHKNGCNEMTNPGGEMPAWLKIATLASFFVLTGAFALTVIITRFLVDYFCFT